MTNEKLNPTPVADEALTAASGGGLLICNIGASGIIGGPITQNTDCFTGGWQSVERTPGGGSFVREDNKELRIQWSKVAAERCCGNCRFLEFDENRQGYCGKATNAGF